MAAASTSTSVSLAAFSSLLRPTSTTRPHLQPRPSSSKLPTPHCLSLTLTRAAPRVAAARDVVQKDWSFLEAAGGASVPRALAAGALTPASRVLVVTPTTSFIGALLASSPCDLLVAAHESLHVLADVKNEHDEARCFHLEGGGGAVEAVPERFNDFDAVFVCYFPGMGVSADALLKSLAKRCTKGSRVVIFLDQGRQTLKQHRREHPDVVTSDLPSMSTLEKAATGNKYEIAEFVDDTSLYLAVLQFLG